MTQAFNRRALRRWLALLDRALSLCVVDIGSWSETKQSRKQGTAQRPSVALATQGDLTKIVIHSSTALAMNGQPNDEECFGRSLRQRIKKHRGTLRTGHNGGAVATKCGTVCRQKG